MKTLPLFVFGTLRRGECNHHLLAGRYDRMAPATLHGFHRLAPLMIAPRPGSQVPGELFFISSRCYSQTLAECDELEGIAPGETSGRDYRRIEVVVETAEGPHAAWAYVEAGSGK